MTLTFSKIYRVTEAFVDNNSAHTPCHIVAVLFRERTVEKAEQYLSGAKVGIIDADFVLSEAFELKRNLVASDGLVVALADLVSAIFAEADNGEA